MAMAKTTEAKEGRENLFLNLLINIALPAVVLMQLSSEDRLGPINGLLLALAIPLSYGLYDLVSQRRLNLFSSAGIMGILLTAGIGLFRLDPQWVAIKEGAVPFAIGVAIVGTQKTKYPLMKAFMSKLVDVRKVESDFAANGTKEMFERRLVLSSYLAAASMFISAAMNFALAKVIIVSQPGTVAFNQELGKFTILEVPIITIPSIIILILIARYLFVGVKKQSQPGLKSLLR